MKKFYTRRSIFSICVFLMAFGQLSGADTANIVGSRKVSQEKKLEIKKQRMLEASEDAKDDSESPIHIMPIPYPDDSSEVMKKSAGDTIYSTTHGGALHYPIFVSALGDSVQLEDESVWSIRPVDFMKTLNWLTTDTILILPPGWFSSYDYVLLNTATNVYVSVDLVAAPRYNGIFTHWVVAIDYSTARLCLEDGSIWSISSFDSSIIGDWLINDSIIIGVNNDWLSGWNPNILINATVDEYVRSKCIY